MGWPGRSGPTEPSAAERAGCVACGRVGTRTEPTGLADGTTAPTCIDVKDCLGHARKVGTYCAI